MKALKINHSDLLDGADLAALVRKACADAGSQRLFAERVGVSSAFMNAVMHAKRPPSPSILEAIGVRKITRYVRTEP